MLTAACSGSAATTTAPDADPATAPPTAATSSPASTVAGLREFDFSLPGPPAQRVEMITADGVTLVADLHPGGPDAFILGHGNNGDRTGLEGLAAGLAREGFTVLNLDFRGHGESGGDGIARNIVDDLDAAARLVRAEGARRVFVVGLQMGGTAALQMAIDGGAGFDGVLAMFAPPTYHGLNAEAGLDQVAVPTMYFSTDVRGGSVKWANQLHALAPDPKKLMILPPGPTGVAFLDAVGNDLVAGMLELFDLA